MVDFLNLESEKWFEPLTFIYSKRIILLGDTNVVVYPGKKLCPPPARKAKCLSGI
jgi:hypothetical protein